MPVRVLFFGATAELVGQREIEMSSLSGLRVSEVLAQLQKSYSGFSKQKLLLTVNQEYSTGNEIVEDGDELAIFTAVSGG